MRLQRIDPAEPENAVPNRAGSDAAFDDAMAAQAYGGQDHCQARRVDAQGVTTTAPHWLVTAAAMSTTGKSQSELLAIADEALRSQPGCETARVVALAPLPHA